MAAMSSEGDGVVYAIALAGSCTGEGKMSVILEATVDRLKMKLKLKRSARGL